MAMLENRASWVVGLLAAALWAAPAVAQDGGGDVSWVPEPADSAAEPGKDSGEDPFAEPKDGRWYIGGFYRHTWTPGFMLGIFLDEHTKANNPGTGLEVTYSRSHLDISITAFWQGYRTYGPYRGSGDPLIDTEMIDSSLSMAAIGANFLWTTEFNDKFALQYGIDLAIGVVMGNLIRNEAYPTNDTSVDGYKGGWAPCERAGVPSAPQSPDFPSDFCAQPLSGGTTDADGQSGFHYGVKARRWTAGGSVPNVWFRAAIPHLALRFTPTPAIRIRVDGGFDLLSGFFFGAALAIGL
jgi:hypothetical protein